MSSSLTVNVKAVAKEAGADLVGVASIDRFKFAPKEYHPQGIFGKTESVIVLACRMVRGALKTVEEGNYWTAYVGDSYQYMNEVFAPHMLRKIVMFLEDLGYTSVPIRNPFAFHQGKPIKEGGTAPDGGLNLRAAACAAGLGEFGHGNLFLTPQFGPRQRLYAVLTDAALDADPLLEEPVCDNCGTCVKQCPAEAIGEERLIEYVIDEKTFSHAPLDKHKCMYVHLGWDRRFSPFLDEEHSRANPPPYYDFLDRRFRHKSICVGRGCIRACMDHLEKTGKIEKQYKTPMIEGEQWEIEE